MKTLREIIQNETEIQVPEGLTTRILTQIRIESNKRLHRESFVWGGIFLLSFITFCASLVHTTKIVMASNFGNYFSLIFSDSNLIISIWKQLSLSLIESLPFVEVSLVLISCMILLWSIRNFVRKSPFTIIQASVPFS